MPHIVAGADDPDDSVILWAVQAIPLRFVVPMEEVCIRTFRNLYHDSQLLTSILSRLSLGIYDLANISSNRELLTILFLSRLKSIKRSDFISVHFLISPYAWCLKCRAAYFPAAHSDASSHLYILDKARLCRSS